MNTLSIHIEKSTKSIQDISVSNNYRNINECINAANRSYRVILNHIIGRIFFYDNGMYESQSQIAFITGYTRQTVNEAIAYWKKLGIITTSSRHKNKFAFDSLEYTIHDNLIKFKFHLCQRLTSLRNVPWRILEKVILKGNPTPIKDEVLNKPSNINLHLKEGVQRGLNFIKKDLKPKRVVMDEGGNIVISPTLREITQKLNLSRLGQLKLLVFSDQVLSVVFSSLKTTKSHIKSPFEWLIVACEQYSKSQSIPVDWSIFYTLLKRYNVKDNKVYIRPAPVKTSFVAASSCVSSRIPRWQQFQSGEVAKGFEEFTRIREENQKI